MAALPPPPLRAEVGSFQWLDWYNKLQSAITVPGSITWATIDKSGSSLTDIQTRQHAQLQSIQGGSAGERYHLTFAEYGHVQTLPNISGNAATATYATTAGSATVSGNVSGIVAIANGGTGATSAAAALTALGAYPASNPSGYTSNTGTVTSVAGTGTVSGLSLSGTVTTSGNITLGGSLDLSSPPAIGATAPNTGKFTNLEATGTVKLGTYTASVGLTTTGYITITDSGGTTRRLAVV